MKPNWNRILSALLTAFYLFVTFGHGGPEIGFKAALCLVLPLACIWFADELGGYIGPMGRAYVNATSPGLVVCILGWLVMLLPFIMWLVSALAGSKS